MEHERFAPLVLEHTAMMARVAAALVGADAEDAAQEALVRAWRAWPTLRDPASTCAWLMQITVNVCRSWRARGQGLRMNTEDRLDAAPVSILTRSTCADVCATSRKICAR
ncbi:MAG TPA: sigma factor [Ktedonobacterales bacterium]